MTLKQVTFIDTLKTELTSQGFTPKEWAQKLPMTKTLDYEIFIVSTLMNSSNDRLESKESSLFDIFICFAKSVFSPDYDVETIKDNAIEKTKTALYDALDASLLSTVITGYSFDTTIIQELTIAEFADDADYITYKLPINITVTNEY